jgi:hypothetical protein
MCAPALAPLAAPAVIAPVALAAGGSLLQAAGQGQAARGRANAQLAGVREGAALSRAEMERQRGFAQASRDAVDGARRTWEATPTTMAQAEASRRTAYDAAAAGEPRDYLPGQSEAARVEVHRRRDANAATLQGENAWRAVLDSWGDASGTGRIASMRSGDEVGVQAGFARGSASVLPIEQQAVDARTGAAVASAARRGQNLRTLGDLTMGAAMLAPGLVATRYPTWASVFSAAPAKTASGTAAYRLGEDLLRRGIY